MSNELLLQAAGITLPPGANESEIIRKLLADNFVNQSVMEFLVSRFAAEALATRNGLEKVALRRRLRLAEPAPKIQVHWGLLSPDQTKVGRAIVKATWGAETINFQGTVAELKNLRFHGEACPGDIFYLYEQYSAPAPDPMFLRDQRERQSYAKEDKGWGIGHGKLSKEEVLAQEQIRVDFGIPSTQIILD